MMDLSCIEKIYTIAKRCYMIVSNHYIPVSILVKGQTTIGSR